jgi:hypothetical protein
MREEDDNQKAESNSFNSFITSVKFLCKNILTYSSFYSESTQTFMLNFRNCFRNFKEYFYNKILSGKKNSLISIKQLDRSNCFIFVSHPVRITFFDVSL